MIRSPWRPGPAAAALLLALLCPLPGRGAPASAAPSEPLRIGSGVELWSIPDAALRRFVADGSFTDQRLMRLVARSGWPEEALRAALVKVYAVDLVALSRFLDSPAGVLFLRQQTRAYRPLSARPGGEDLRIPALRAAILAEARGGSVTALGILRRLPAPLVIDLAGPSPLRCSSLPCESTEQCSSVLSWLAFLPACLQAATVSTS